MKYIKMLGLAAVAAAALMAFVGASTASATILTGEGGTKLGENTEIHAVNEGNVVLTTEFLNITCSSSTVAGKTTNAGGGSGVAVTGNVETLTFTSCNCPVTVLKRGTLAVNWTSGSNGSVTSSGAEVTVNCSTIFGTVHCIYTTNNTSLGTVTGSATTGKTATMDIASADIPRETTSSLCDKTANWDAKYEVTAPDVLNIDKE